MKGKLLLLLQVTLLALVLCSCGAIPATETDPASKMASSSMDPKSSNTSAAMVPKKRKPVSLEIHSSSENKIQIPNPAEVTEETVSIALQTEAEEDELYDSDTEDAESSPLNKRYRADLSFAGLGTDTMVSAYTTGNLTDPDSHSKDCLALFVHENPETEQKKNYFLVLDYGNGTYYRTETAFFLHSWGTWVNLAARDLTGDGVQELVVSHIYNRSVEVGVFRCDEPSHRLIPLFSTLDDVTEETDYPDRSWFRGHLEDDYQVVLEFPEIGYSKTVSMIRDGGYPKKALQAGSKATGRATNNVVTLWKEGILQKKQLDKDEDDPVFLYTLDHVDYPTGTSGKPQLELVRAICIRHRAETIGNMHLFLQYDAETDRMIPKKAKYVNAKKAEKEFKTFEEWN